MNNKTGIDALDTGVSDLNISNNLENHKTTSKGTGFLRAKSPKKVAKLFSQTSSQEENMEQTQQITQNLNNAELKNETTSQEEKITEVKKVFHKPSPLTPIKKPFKSRTEQNPNQSSNYINNKNHKHHDKKYPNPNYQDKDNKHNVEKDSRDEYKLEVIKEHPPVEKVLSIIRQRTGFVPANFWAEMDIVQSSDKPIDLEKESNKIITYAVLFNKESIYLDLLEKYGKYLKVEDFEGNLIPYCSDKAAFFLDKTIVWYENLFSDKNRLANLLIDKLTYCSFRQENNFIWLSWLDKNATEEQLNKFWNFSFECNNIVLIMEALHFKKLASYIKKNLDSFNSSIDISSKTHQIQSLIQNPDFYVDRSNKHTTTDYESDNKSFENSLIAQMKNQSKEDKKDKKEDNTTEVVVKRKKNLEHSPFN